MINIEYPHKQNFKIYGALNHIPFNQWFTKIQHYIHNFLESEFLYKYIPIFLYSNFF